MKPESGVADDHAGRPAHVVVVEEDRRSGARRPGSPRTPRRSRCGSPGPARRLARAPTARSTSLKVSTFCGLPSSETAKSACVRSFTGLPRESVTMTSTRTKLTPARKVGSCCWPVPSAWLADRVAAAARVGGCWRRLLRRRLLAAQARSVGARPCGWAGSCDCCASQAACGLASLTVAGGRGPAAGCFAPSRAARPAPLRPRRHDGPPTGAHGRDLRQVGLV